jgi:hypothetical protein
VLLTLNENSSKFEKKSIDVEFIRVAYDLEKASKAIEDSNLPDAYADMLRRAY